MNRLAFKYISVTPPAAIIDNAAVTTAEIDTLGWDHAEIVVYLGATDIAMTVLAVTESDTAGSGHANITGLVWGTSSNIGGTTSALPSATDDNKFQVAQIDMRGRKRYLKLSATVGDGTLGAFVSSFARLTRGEVSPITAAEAGCDEILRV